MGQPRHVLCSGLKERDVPLPEQHWKTLELNAHGEDANVHIHFQDVAKALGQPLSPRLFDFLEIATYVYAADCATNRGQGWSRQGAEEAWERHFRFVIPVSDAEFWSRSDVEGLLRRCLTFLSNDRYEFDFRSIERRAAGQGYFDFGGDEAWPFHKPERVVMFSGGLDSLAGAAETAAAGKNLVLVSHRSHPVLSTRQAALFRELNRRYNVQMLHIPVWINKEKGLDRESTQRTRSFLFTALGTFVAESIEAGGVRFFENGVVSLNLPVAQEALRARASRTTHPYALHVFTRLVKMVLERDFEVDNPYLFKTKTEVVQVLTENCGSELVGYSVSCAHQGRSSSRSQYHCGTCSQCIDRRVAILAAGAGDHDPETDYKTDVFLGSRREGYEQNMAVDYAAHVVELNNMSEDDIAIRFSSELARAVRHMSRPTQSAQSLVRLHSRHASAALGVIRDQAAQHIPDLIAGSLPPKSMIQMIAGQAHRRSSWQRLADRIARHLEEGLPRACATEKPANEPRLQEICDAILKPLHSELVREFPFMRWSASATKPDWSADEPGLWVELKYVRQKRDIRQVTEDVAADITKYGDNARHTLFVVYDPEHLVIDQNAFCEPILQHGHVVTFIR